MVNPPKGYVNPNAERKEEVSEAVPGSEGESQHVPPGPETEKPATSEEGVVSNEPGVGESLPPKPGEGAPHDELY